MFKQIENIESAKVEENSLARKCYLATWRWHFYAGIFVIPFMFILSVTGLVMLYDDVIQEARYGEQLNVIAQPGPSTPSQQLTAVQVTFPDAAVKKYTPPEGPARSSQIAIVDKGGEGLLVNVNPYTNEVLGTINRDDSWYALANDIHGTLLMGDSGDRIIEISAGLAVMLVITGLYLWWPRNRAGKSCVFWPRLNSGKRAFWRDLHASLGLYSAAFLLFFLISGLAWAGIWGGKIVQPWSSFPAEKWENVPLSDENHAAMNHGALKEVPWGLEQTALPESGSNAGSKGVLAHQVVNIDTINTLATQLGFTNFQVNLPRGEQGVFTISADTMSGDITDPRLDRTVHIDQYTGNVLADVGWNEYSPMAKAMAAGIALHQGDISNWNLAANTLLCVVFAFISASGVAMWWLRRPKGALNLGAPPLPKDLPLWKGAVVIMLLISLAFPLLGLTLLVVLCLDLLVLSRVPALQKLFS